MYINSVKLRLPPWGGSGLKSECAISALNDARSPSLGREWIEIPKQRALRGVILGLPPWGGSGLKFFIFFLYILKM